MSLHSKLFKFSGKSSILSWNLEEPLELDENVDYGIGLINLETYHSFPNIIEGENNKLYIDNDEISFPTGTYELSDINEYIQKHLDSQDVFEVYPNYNTLKCHLKSNREVDFSKKGTFASLLGFEEKKLLANEMHTSENSVNIMKTNAICVDCNIATGSYDNGKSGHLIYSFFPLVPVGAKIVETPQNIIYLPISVRTIRNISLKIVDQDGELVNLRGETVTVTLHLKPV